MAASRKEILDVSLNGKRIRHLRFNARASGSASGNGVTNEVSAFTAMATRVLAEAQEDNATETEIEFPPGRYRVATNYSWPNTITIKPQRGAVFIPTAGVTLTIPRFVGDDYKYFDLSQGGTVLLPETDEVRVSWFTGAPTGANQVIADTTGVQAAFAANPTRHTPVKFGPGRYRFHGINPQGHGWVIQGDSRETTILESSDGSSIFDISQGWFFDVEWKDLRLDGRGQARVTGNNPITFPVALSGLTIRLDVTINDVVQPTTTFTFPAVTYNSMASILANIGNYLLPGKGPGGLAGVTAATDLDGTRLVLQTTWAGTHQSITIRDDSTALTALGFTTSQTATGSSGHGIRVDTGELYSARLQMENVDIVNTGGKGVFIERGFSCTLKHVDVDNCGDDAFDIHASNTTALYDCYPKHVGVGSAGFRIRVGQAALINCNGIHGGKNTRWGEFGSCVNDGDPENAYAHVALINCNIEDFSGIGVWCKINSQLNVINTKWQGPTAEFLALTDDTPPIALLSDASSVVFDNASGISTKGAGWAGTYPIHWGKALFGHTILGNGTYLETLPNTATNIGLMDMGGGTTHAMTIPRLSVNYTRYLTPTLKPSNIELPVGASGSTFLGSRLMGEAAAPPVGPVASYVKNDILLNTSPAIGQPIGWVCVESGIPGTWAPFGMIVAA